MKWKLVFPVWESFAEHSSREHLTFQILILLAHRPHADLIVDHVDTRKAASEVGDNINILSIVKELKW